MTTLRVACVGAGYFSQFHYDSWARIDGVTLVGACDHDIDKARATGATAFKDVTQMLAQTTPDILDIIVPPAAQADVIRIALDAGIETLICQKPFCTDLAEATEITALAAAQGAQLIIHENFRFQPWYRTIHAALDAGRIGDVHQLTFRLRTGDGQGPQAYLDRQPYFQTMERFLVRETGVHFIDVFRFLLGPPTAVYADLRQMNPVIAGEDAGHILFDHPGGVRALFDGNRHLDHAADNPRCTMGEALVEGSVGTLTLTGDGAVHLRGHGTRIATCLLAADTSPNFGGDCVHHLQSHIAAALKGGTPPENTAQDYLEVLRVEDAVYRSAQSGRKEPV